MSFRCKAEKSEAVPPRLDLQLWEKRRRSSALFWMVRYSTEGFMPNKHLFCCYQKEGLRAQDQKITQFGRDLGRSSDQAVRNRVRPGCSRLVAQRGGRCPMAGNIQGQVRQGSEQLDLVEDVPAHCRGVGLDDL